MIVYSDTNDAFDDDYYYIIIQYCGVTNGSLEFIRMVQSL